MTRGRIRYRWEKKFEKKNDFQFLYPSLTELLKMDVLAEFDVEDTGVLLNGSATHGEHGDIDFTDLQMISGLDELLGLSAGAPAFIMENVGSLTQDAIEMGMDKALAKLKAMPIDSTAWTGLPRGFVFTEEIKDKMLSLLDQSIESLSNSQLSNFEIGQGVGLLKAVRELADTPEPPKNDIWSILNKGSVIASLAGFFMPILGLLKGA